jgi:hypothetical protein
MPSMAPNILAVLHVLRMMLLLCAARSVTRISDPAVAAAGVAVLHCPLLLASGQTGLSRQCTSGRVMLGYMHSLCRRIWVCLAGRCGVGESKQQQGGSPTRMCRGALLSCSSVAYHICASVSVH